MSNNISQRVRQLRKHFGFDLKDLADFLGVKEEFLYAVEDGSSSLSVCMVEKLSRLYGQSLLEPYREIEPACICYIDGSARMNSDDMKIISEINNITMECDFITEFLEAQL